MQGAGPPSRLIQIMPAITQALQRSWWPLAAADTGTDLRNTYPAQGGTRSCACGQGDGSRSGADSSCEVSLGSCHFCHRLIELDELTSWN